MKIRQTYAPPFVKWNILIALFASFLLLLGIIFLTSYHVPSELQETTGIIKNYTHYEKKWYSDLFGVSTTSNFTVELEDGAYFQTPGISYDNIDKTLFDHIQVGDEITIIYVDNGIVKPNSIYGIEYKNKTYLDKDKVIKDFKSNNKIGKIIGYSSIGTMSILCPVLVVINYRKNKSN